YAGYLGVVAGIKDNSHVAIDVVLTGLPKNVRKWVERCNHVIRLDALVAVVIISMLTVQNQADVNIVSPNISMASGYLEVPILTLLMIYRMIERIIKDWRKDSRTTSEVE